jgi:two-component system, sensor histidine kinase and response regulator
MSLNVLVVDDQDTNRFLIQEILTEMTDFCTVYQADSGKSCFKLLETQAIDLILLDILMPEMDGFEVAAQLKADEKNKDIPIIFLTAIFKDEMFVNKGFDIGAVDYMTKPVNPALLIEKITTFNK